MSPDPMNFADDRCDDLGLKSQPGETWTADSVAELFESYRDRLMRCVLSWMPRTLERKYGPDDILQDAVIAAIRNPQRMASLDVVPFVWFRSLAREALDMRIRAYLKTLKRDAHREESLEYPAIDPQTSQHLLRALADTGLSPSSAVRRQEMITEVQQALLKLSAADFEMIRLTQIEGLTTSETAQILRVTDSSVSKGKLRALEHLRTILQKSSSEFH